MAPQVNIYKNKFWYSQNQHNVEELELHDKMIMKLSKLFNQMVRIVKFFGQHEWTFHQDNVTDMIKRVKLLKDRDIVKLDLWDMDWKKYMITYMAGIEKFILREDSKSIDTAQKRLLFLYRIHQIVMMSSRLAHESSHAKKKPGNFTTLTSDMLLNGQGDQNNLDGSVSYGLDRSVSYSLDRSVSYSLLYFFNTAPNSNRTLKLGSWNALPCREVPDAMARSYLRDICLTPERQS
ncbi:hypothetical protein WN51_07410 [Melipona quadrifasciata]|uniref:Fatty acyl-CoA reductase C-terminal domain-containing protein n=1 Tax=Melipona quadrifasciata TaxID=166423 RepID=A0A0N0BCH1_9HYME|nr:hypothetical protein WN51_07410 [Melipona quadrifasciata]